MRVGPLLRFAAGDTFHRDCFHVFDLRLKCTFHFFKIHWSFLVPCRSVSICSNFFSLRSLAQATHLTRESNKSPDYALTRTRRRNSEFRIRPTQRSVSTYVAVVWSPFSFSVRYCSSSAAGIAARRRGAAASRPQPAGRQDSAVRPPGAVRPTAAVQSGAAVEQPRAGRSARRSSGTCQARARRAEQPSCARRAARRAGGPRHDPPTTTTTPPRPRRTQR